MMEQECKARLVQACRRIGSQVPFWTQGPGGNVSVKSGDNLWIKASGLRLDSVSEEQGLAKVDLPAFLSEMESPNLLDVERQYAEALTRHSENGRPSMETAFHALLPGRFVFHFHALSALLMAHELKRDQSNLFRWIQTHATFKIEFVPCIRPGWTLGQELRDKSQCAALILENHGVVLQAENEDILDQWRHFEMAFCQQWGYQKIIEPCNTRRAFDGPLKIYFPDTAVFMDRLKDILIKKDHLNFSLKSTAWNQDRDAAELWVATQILFDSCPALSELSSEISSVIAGLPTEIFRRSIRN
jgi:ribulose-5-phosphate 4-epimerase/fuculose-1-phosphate aldolase